MELPCHKKFITIQALNLSGAINNFIDYRYVLIVIKLLIR